MTRRERRERAESKARDELTESIARKIADSDKSHGAIIEAVRGCGYRVWRTLDNHPRGRRTPHHTWHPYLRRVRNGDHCTALYDSIEAAAEHE